MEVQKDIDKIKNKFEAALQFQTEVIRFFHIQFLSSIRLRISYTKKIDRKVQSRKFPGQRQKYQIRRIINFLIIAA